MARSVASAVLDDYEWITALTKSLVFGDRFLVPVFCRAVNNFIIDQILSNDVYFEIPPPFFTAAKYAFENLPEDHVILQFFVKVHCRFWVVQTDGEARTVSKILLQLLPPALLVKIMVRYACKAAGGEKWRIVSITCTLMTKTGSSAESTSIRRSRFRRARRADRLRVAMKTTNRLSLCRQQKAFQP
jgi:hypothetical protein